MSVCAVAVLLPFDIFTANAVHTSGLRNGDQKITSWIWYRSDTGLDLVEIPVTDSLNGTEIGAQAQRLEEGGIYPLQCLGSDFLLQVESA